MDNLLYYPYINLPDTDWTIRAMLYYDRIGTIVPGQYFNEPERYEPFMLEVVQNELITPIDPMHVIDHPVEISEVFCNYLNDNLKSLEKRGVSLAGSVTSHIRRRDVAPNKTWCRLHADKLDAGIFYNLMHMGLAERIDDYWYNVEKKTADELMTFLASVIARKIDYQPVTDKIDNSFSTAYISNQDFELRTRQYKRDVILKHLIPYPKEIDLTNLMRFKERHNDLLRSFRNKVELLALNPAFAPDSQHFTVALDDMKMAKEELSAKMNESHMGDIVFGTVCGTVAAGIGILANPVVGAIPGLLSAIYSACRIERPEDVIDQTGLKYIALVDKRLRR